MIKYSLCVCVCKLPLAAYYTLHLVAGVFMAQRMGHGKKKSAREEVARDAEEEQEEAAVAAEEEDPVADEAPLVLAEASVEKLALAVAAGRAGPLKLDPFVGGAAAGSSDFMSWWWTANLYLQGSTAPDDVKIRAVLLAVGGTAKDALRTAFIGVDPVALSFDEFSKTIKKVLCLQESEDQADDRIRREAQLRGTDLEVYIRAFNAAACKGLELEAKHVARLFISGLGACPLLQDIVRKSAKAAPNLQDLFAVARDNSGCLHTAAAPTAAPPAATSDNAGESVNAMRGRTRGSYGGGRGGWRERGDSPERTRGRVERGWRGRGRGRIVKCFNCGGVGHMRAACPTPAVVNSTSYSAESVSVSLSCARNITGSRSIRPFDANLKATLHTANNGVHVLQHGALLDSGATSNLIAWRTVHQCGLEATPAPDSIRFQFADGSFYVSSWIVKAATIKIGEATTSVDLRVVKLRQLDVVLGATWLSAHNPRVDWATGEISVEAEDGKGRLMLRPAQRKRHTSPVTESVAATARAATTAAVTTQSAAAKVADDVKAQQAPSMQEVSAKALDRLLRRKAGQVDSVHVVWLSSTHDAQTERVCAAQQQQQSHESSGSDKVQLPATGNEELRGLLEEYRDLFRPPTTLPPLRPGMQHPVHLHEDAEPPARPPYRLAWAEQEELKKQLQALLDQGLIAPSQSPYGAPVLLVKKKDGTFRMCVDYRALNKTTVRDRYPIPIIQDLLDRLQGATVFTKLDLKSGYFQLRVEPADEEKTAFVTRFGTFQFRVLPMGMANAPSTFQRAMQQVFGELVDTSVLIYLDDILIFSKTVQQHVEHLREVLRRLRQHQFLLAPSKCVVGQPSVVFLGHQVSAEAVAVEDAKVEAIRQWPRPKNRTDVQRFLGFANFYRNFVPRFADIAAPLTSLLRKDAQPFVLGDAGRAAFHILKAKLMNAPVLAMPRQGVPFVVTVDASDIAVGAVLEQEDARGLRHPVAYASKALTAAEKNYAIRDKELLAQVYALEHWRVYLLGARFEVVTDHASLRTLDEQDLKTARIARWVARLQDYDYGVTYTKGRDNIADALSRLPSRSAEDGGASSLQQPEVAAPVRVAVEAQVQARDKERVQQLHGDKYFGPIVELLQGTMVGSPSLKLQRRVRRYFIDGEHLYLREDDGTRRRCIPRAARQLMLQEYHDTPLGGHQGVNRMYAAMRPTLFWPKMAGDIRRFCRTCELCQRNKAAQRIPHAPSEPLETPSLPWESVSLDFMDLPMSTRGHDSVLVVTDRFSGMLHCVPTTRTATARDTVDLMLTEVVRLHGVPRSIVSDRDVRFTSELWASLWEALGTRLKMTTAHRPQADGKAERSNRTVQTVLRHFCNSLGTDWDAPHLRALIELGINAGRHASTGLSSFQVATGSQPMIPATLEVASTVGGRSGSSVALGEERMMQLQRTWEQVQDSLRQARDRQAEEMDARNRTGADTAPTFHVGDKVLLHTKNYPALRPTKLHSPYVGPFEVLECPSASTVRLAFPPHMSRLHPVINVEALKRFVVRPGKTPAPGPVGTDAQGHELWEVEKILRDQVRRGKKFYLVRWKGFGPEDDTWEPETNMRKFNVLVSEYYQTRPQEPLPKRAARGRGRV